MPTNRHTLTRIDNDLDAIRALIPEMGALVESQLKLALQALLSSDHSLAHFVIDQDYAVNQMDMRIDALCTSAIARQHPTASDLRLILNASKIAILMELIGDETKKIARIAQCLAQYNRLPRARLAGVNRSADLALQRLAEAIACYAHLDIFSANKLISGDVLNNDSFDSVCCSLIHTMSETPRSISSSLEIIFIAKAIEHIGTYTSHIARLVVASANRYDETLTQPVGSQAT